MHHRTAVIWDAVCMIRQCRDWWNLQKNDISVWGQLYKPGGLNNSTEQQMGLAESHSGLLSTNMCLIKEKLNQVATTG